MRKTSMTRLFHFWIMICLAAQFACHKDYPVHKCVTFHGLKIYVLEKKEKIFEGVPVGVDFANNEAYIKSLKKEKGKFSIRVIDIDSFDTLRIMELPTGESSSPGKYTNPVYIESFANRFFIADHFDKIVVTDLLLNPIYALMYKQPRYFIDIFPFDRDMFFLAGTRDLAGEKIYSQVKLYHVNEANNSLESMTISPRMEILNSTPTKTGTELPVGYFWPSPHGIEKEGILYYSMGDQPAVFVYDINIGIEEVYVLTYLEGKKYSSEEATKLGGYHPGGGTGKNPGKHREQAIYKAYPGEMYHFGIYDAGKEKIGIAADINLEDMTYRFDIIDINTWEYIGSLRLPVDEGFKRSLAGNYRGLTRNYIDVDKGVYVHLEAAGEDPRLVTKIDRFKLKY